MKNENDEQQIFYEMLIQLRDSIGGSFTDHGCKRLSEQLVRYLTIEQMKSACRFFIENFEKKPSKMFPEPKDFIVFSKKQFERTWLQKKWDWYSKKLGIPYDEVREFQFYRLDAALKLKKHPKDLPWHADDLTPEERKILDIPEKEERKKLFAEIYKKIGVNIDKQLNFETNNNPESNRSHLSGSNLNENNKNDITYEGGGEIPF